MNHIEEINSTNKRTKWLKRSALLIGILAIFAIFSTAHASGAEQFSGVARFAEEGECNDPSYADADGALYMEGDLEGCLYTFIDYENSRFCSPGDTYHEVGNEVFVGTYKGEYGTIGTEYVFTAKFSDCPTFAGQLSGGCRHPFVAGTGTGVFEGKRGRFNIDDDIAAGNFPYKGHLK